MMYDRKGGLPDWKASPDQYPPPTGGGSDLFWPATSLRGALQVCQPPTPTIADRLFEAWLGNTVPFRMVFATGQGGQKQTKAQAVSNRRAYMEDTGYIVGTDKTIIITIPLCFNKSTTSTIVMQTLDEVANTNANDQFWQDFGAQIAQEGHDTRRSDGRPKIVLRIGWEHNGTWYAWGTGTLLLAQLYKKAYERAMLNIGIGMVTSDPATTWVPNMANVYFDWNIVPNKGSVSTVSAAMPVGQHPENVIITAEWYDSSYKFKDAWNAGKRPGTAAWETVSIDVFNDAVNGTTGIDWIAKLASDNNRLFGIDEGGMKHNDYVDNVDNFLTGGQDDPNFFQRQADRMDLYRTTYNHIAWHGLFNRNSSTEGNWHQLTDEVAGVFITSSRFPNAAAKYRALFGG